MEQLKPEEIPRQLLDDASDHIRNICLYCYVYVELHKDTTTEEVIIGGIKSFVQDVILI